MSFISQKKITKTLETLNSLPKEKYPSSKYVPRKNKCTSPKISSNIKSKDIVTLYIKRDKNQISSGTKKTIQFFEYYNINYQTKEIHEMSLHEFAKIVADSQLGLNEFITKRTDVFRKHIKNIAFIEEIPFYNALKILLKFPSLIAGPIIVDKNKIAVGYNNEEIRCFIPKNIKKIERYM